DVCSSDLALRQGYILTPYFAEALPAYEKQEQPMKSYYPDMVMAIDLMKEEKRLADVEFDKQAAVSPLVKSPAPPSSPPPPPLTRAAQTLADAERLWGARNEDAT